MPGFQSIIRRDRVSGVGGGVALYVSRALKVKRRDDLTIPGIEILWVEIHLHNNKFLLAVVYRPPNSPVSFWDDLQASYDLACSTTSNKIVLMGDFNADPRTSHGKKLISFSNANALTLHVQEPTRITDTTSSCLDQIVTNIPSFVKKVKVIPPVANNDHCTVAANLLFRHTKKPSFDRFIWLFSKTDFDKFREALDEVNWDPCFNTDDLDEMCEMWTSTFLNTARQRVANRTITVRQGDAPWYTSSLRAQKRKVDRIHNKAKSSKNHNKIHLWRFFRDLRNKYINDLRSAEEEYYQRHFDLVNNSKQKGKRWWKTVGYFIKGDPNYGENYLLDGDTVVSDAKSKAEVFNNFFAKQSLVDDTNFDLPTAQPVHNNKLAAITVSENEVYSILASLDVSKATGPDGLSPKLLKEGASSIAPSLTKLFNISLEKAIFPAEWKKAHVTPIFKSGDASLSSNYRPISLLSCLGKVFERVIFKHTFNFLRDNFVLSEKQSGFMPGDGTVNQLLYLYHEFVKAVDLQKEVRVVYCDITKAFDKVYHPALIHKLSNVGISGSLLDWFKSYLSNRTQRVVLQGELSPWCGVGAGVPQGSVLGPLLFLIYVNDIVDIVGSNIRLYADDVTLFITVDDPTDSNDSHNSAVILNNDLCEIQKWAKQWLVTFNSRKTKTMLVSRKRNPSYFPIYFQGSALENVTSQKYLGLIISSDLSWSNHINHIVSKAKKLIGVMKMLQYKLSRRSLEIVYISYVRPILEYGDVVWGGCTASDAELLEGVQLAAARAVTGATRCTSNSKLYSEIGWETLSKRREKHRLKLFYKMFHGHAPAHLCNLIPENVSSRNPYNVRSKGNISEPKYKLNLYGNSFIPSTIRHWNRLPSAIRNSEDVDTFQRKLDRDKPKSNDLFYIGNRRLNILHARFRMGCSQLNYNMHKMGILSSPACSCGAPVETSYHYFFECPNYVIHRNYLQLKVIPLAPFTLNTLLYGSNSCPKANNKIIFEATQNFISQSGRFKPP